MSIILFTNEEDRNGKIDIDELYDKKQKRDLKQLSIFNRILDRIHKRIKHTSRNKFACDFIWFNVPEYMIGEPIYDKVECIAYLVSNLEDNGFYVKYVHPNTLFISWHNWVPSYVRKEIKKKMGVNIDAKGNIIEKNDEEDYSTERENDNNQKFDIFNGFNDDNNKMKNIKLKKEYTPINKYKPMGNFVYDDALFEKIGKKMDFNR